MSGRYASYWNAFLLYYFSHLKYNESEMKYHDFVWVVLWYFKKGSIICHW